MNMINLFPQIFALFLTERMHLCTYVSVLVGYNVG